ncbi:MAG: dehydrogenase [Patescibacteria group bacterium]|nr:dehydrogenase [Patescibacteria group bacterium]
MTILSRAPLRLGFAGGGTDVSPYSDEYGGCVLNATIDLYSYCILTPQQNGKIHFSARDIGEEQNLEATTFLSLEPPLVLHKAVYNRIIKDFNNGIPLAFDMVTYSDAPPGSGLGSSSTLVVAMITAFAEWLKLPLGEYDVAHLAYQIERKDAGLSGGKQDQYAATFGGFNFIEFYKDDRVVVNPLRIKSWIINELEMSMVLYYTGRSRESAKIIDEQSRNARERDEQTIEAMHELKQESYVMKEALLRGDIELFAQYLGKSWQAKKKTARSITNPQLDAIYDLAMKTGAYAGKISGAGGGGFMMFLIQPALRLELIQTLNSLGKGMVINAHFTPSGAEAWRTG